MALVTEFSPLGDLTDLSAAVQLGDWSKEVEHLITMAVAAVEVRGAEVRAEPGSRRKADELREVGDGDSYAGGREQYGNRVVLVRPDQHVAWAGNAVTDNPIDLWQTVTGR